MVKEVCGEIREKFKEMRRGRIEGSGWQEDNIEAHKNKLEGVIAQNNVQIDRQKDPHTRGLRESVEARGRWADRTEEFTGPWPECCPYLLYRMSSVMCKWLVSV